MRALRKDIYLLTCGPRFFVLPTLARWCCRAPEKTFLRRNGAASPAPNATYAAAMCAKGKWYSERGVQGLGTTT
jgi:hypothetical protein